MMAPTISVVGGGRLCACATSVAPACRPRATAMRAAATGARRPLPCLHFLLLCLCLLQQAYTGSSSSQRAGWARSLFAEVLPIASGWLTIKTLTGRVGLVHKPSECVDKVSSEWSDDDGKGEAELVEMNQAQLLTSHSALSIHSLLVVVGQIPVPRRLVAQLVSRMLGGAAGRTAVPGCTSNGL